MPAPLARSSTEISRYRPLLEKSRRRSREWPAHGRRPTAVAARRPRRGAGLAGGCHDGDFTRCRVSQHTVDLFDTVLIALQHDRICRRCHRRGRHLRHQRGLASAGPLPRQELRDPGAPREPRRHLGPVQVPRASARTPTCSPSDSGSSRGRSAKAIADGPSILNYLKDAAAENGIDKHMRLRPEGGRRRLVRRRQPLDRARRQRGERREITLLVPVRVHRLLQLRRGLLARVRRLRGLRRAPSCTRSTGRRTSTTRARRSSSSAAAPPP